MTTVRRVTAGRWRRGSADLLEAHEKHLKTASTRACNILRRQCLWGCNRYVLVRDVWKSVHLPGQTFANATLCLSANTREWLERGQHAVGRLTLGCHGRVAVEAIQGDLGWSAFEALEAQSKITYEVRLRTMDDTRWARKLFRYINIVAIRTQWCARVHTLRQKYGFLTCTDDKAVLSRSAVRTLVRQVENAKWSANAQKKTTMALYCAHKGEISEESLYDNSVGSALLFEARAGALRTLCYRRQFDTDPDVQVALRRVCGSEEETIEHIVLNCSQLTPRPTEDTSLPVALGFESAADQRYHAVSVAKARLRMWWTSVRR